MINKASTSFDDSFSDKTARTFMTKSSAKRSKQPVQPASDKESVEAKKQEELRNVVVFTGHALAEILKDQTMQKSFLTLAQISDLMIASSVSPNQKQRLIKMVKDYIGEDQYTAAIITATEDQFMMNEADLVLNLKQPNKSIDFKAIADLTFKDFSAIGYLLFKHGNFLSLRISRATQAFLYRTMIALIFIGFNIFISGLSDTVPFSNFFHFFLMLIQTPGEILVYAMFFKDYGHDFLYRIFGSYKYNFTFSSIETENLMLDMLLLSFDFFVIYLPVNHFMISTPVSITDGKEISQQAFFCYNVILMEMLLLFYFLRTNIKIIYANILLATITCIGAMMVLDDEGLIGIRQFLSCPLLIIALFLQFGLLFLRNTIVEVLLKYVIKKSADKLNWFANIEDRLDFEEFEDPAQVFSIS